MAYATALAHEPTFVYATILAHRVIISRYKMLNRFQTLFYRYAPGIILCCIISLIAILLERLELVLFGQAWLESLVLAILVGAIFRTAKTLPKQYAEGIGFSAKILLEIAVALLGSSISVHAVLSAGLGLIAGIAAIVFCVIVITYTIGRFMGLTRHLAILVACGNSICGNSAIAAVAPVIKANASDVAASIAFTAVLGIFVILVLPFAVPALGLSFSQYGILAGMTVYAVPQVLAAAAPVSLVSVQMATLVKLVRVLMLGPVIFIIGLIAGAGSHNRPSFGKLVPWFIIGFVVLLLANSANIIPEAALKVMAATTKILTVISMAALGLGVDVYALKKSGIKVISTAVISIIILALSALIMIFTLNIA